MLLLTLKLVSSITISKAIISSLSPSIRQPLHPPSPFMGAVKVCACINPSREPGRESIVRQDFVGFASFDDPPIPVNVGDEGEYSNQFATLRPGESWKCERRVQCSRWTDLPDDVKAGEKFKYMVKGAVVDWWDWGTKEDHKETKVKLPCFVSGDLEEPTDNGGRPKLIVPASNEVTFSYDD